MKNWLSQFSKKCWNMTPDLYSYYLHSPPNCVKTDDCAVLAFCIFVVFFLSEPQDFLIYHPPKISIIALHPVTIFCYAHVVDSHHRHTGAKFKKSCENFFLGKNPLPPPPTRCIGQFFCPTSSIFVRIFPAFCPNFEEAPLPRLVPI